MTPTTTSERLFCPPEPGTAEHDSYISASKVPAIMGVCPYGRELHDVYDHLVEPRDSEPPTDPDQARLFRWGHVAEESLLRWWESEHPDITRARQRSHELGGYMLRQTGWHNFHLERESFPHIVHPDGVYQPVDTDGKVATDPRSYHVIECKTGPPRGMLAPTASGPDIPLADAAQIITQMGVTGSRSGWLVRSPASQYQYPEISQVPWNDEAWGLIVDTCARLWDIVQQTRTSPNDEYDAGVELDDLAESIDGHLGTILLRKEA